MSIVNERRPDGKAFVVSQFSYFLGDLVHNFVPDLFLALDFHHHQPPLRTDEEIDLASAMALRRRLNVWERREDKGLVYSQMRKQVVDVVEDKILELEAEATLAANLEEVYVETTDEEIEELKKIFHLGDDYSFEKFQKLGAAPAEYKVLADLIANYHKTLDTVEDYDAPVE